MTEAFADPPPAVPDHADATFAVRLLGFCGFLLAVPLSWALVVVGIWAVL